MTAPDPASELPLWRSTNRLSWSGAGGYLRSLLSFALGTAVLVYAMSSAARYEFVLALYLGVLLVPATFWLKRRRQEGELTLAVLLLITTCAAGPMGVLGCTFLALSLWRRQPAPERLRHWYEYISGASWRAAASRAFTKSCVPDACRPM